MTCTILHSGKQNPIYNPQKRWKENPTFSSTLLPSVGLSNEHPQKKKQGSTPLQPPYVHFTHSLYLCRSNNGMMNLKYELTVWSLNFPLDDVVIPAFSLISLPMLESPIHRLYSVLPRRRQSVCWWRRGEPHAWGRVKAEEGGKGEVLRVGWGGWKSIIYTVTAWLATHLELQVISSQPSNCSISRQQNDYKNQKIDSISLRPDEKHQTENDTNKDSHR